ncbi:MAG: protease modulator HflC [Planctomycetes bacterium]|nr:protease modulator HflC [Planctomycetota bacterium]
MKNVSILVFLVLIVLVLILCSVSYQVRETESALVTRFGEVSREKVGKPGFYWKWPAPIESVIKFDSRSKLLKGRETETTTRGADNIRVTSYLVWKIAEPQKYLESVKNDEDAIRLLRDRLLNVQNVEIGQHYFSEFVNSDKDKIQLAAIEENMHKNIREQALENFGIDIEVVGISRIGISKNVTAKVFDRMKSERTRKTESIIGEGGSVAEKIKAEADSKSAQLLAVVEGYAKSIRGEGDAEAAKYYKMLDEEPEFAMYLQNIETLKDIIDGKTTIILGSDIDIINLLKGIPDIKPKKKSNY